MELTQLLSLITIGIFAETSYLVVKSVQPAKTKDGILVDTSVLIDGRIISIARSGLISAKLIVPRSVVRELQLMADKADHDKRERARYGLDVIDQLQNIEGIAVEVVDDGTTHENGVDEQLMVLSRKWHAKLCTIDYNLNKSARVQGIQVVNINELAHALRINYLPGEKLDVKLQQPGQDSHQAVGYLDDGTMVVVDNAKRFIGQTLTVEATRVLQTAAGKMMFAKHSQPLPAKPKVQRAQIERGSDTQRHTTGPRQNTTRRAKGHRYAPRHKDATPEDAVVTLANRT